MKTNIYKIMLAALCCLLSASSVKADGIVDLKELRYGYENHLIASTSEVHYLFHLDYPMLVVINQAGSTAEKTSLALHSFFSGEENAAQYAFNMESKDKYPAQPTTNLWSLFESSAKIEKDVAELKAEQGFICISLNVGNYELTSRSESPLLMTGCNEGLRTNIYAHSAKATSEDPVIISFRKGGTHRWSADPQNVGTLFYQLDLQANTKLSIEHYGTTISPKLTLLDSKLQKIAEPGENGMIKDSLSAGIYFVRANRDVGDCHSEICITWNETIGNSLEHPIELGLIVDPETTRHIVRKEKTLDIVQLTDTYGEKEKDMVLSFTLEEKAYLDINLLYSSVYSKRGFLTLLNDKYEVVMYVTLSQITGAIRTDIIDPGTYYLVCEAGEGNNGHLICQMIFNFKIKEVPDPDVPNPEPEPKPEPEAPEIPESYVPTATLNYIRTITPMIASYRTDTLLYLSSAEQRIQYYDWLGRPLQTLAYKSSPTRKDLAFHQEYDLLGRDGKKWLAVTRPSGEAGAFITPETIVSGAKALYQDNCAYSYSVYENSPLNRIIEQYGAGEGWQQNGHSIKNDYCINTTADHCLHFRISGKREAPRLGLKASFADNELEVILTQDEDGNSRCSFTDKDGRTILQRSIADNDTLDTYSVYDDYGNICFVLPPTATEMISQMIQPDSSSQETLDKYAYQYRYDSHNRCIGKKLPGCSWTEQIYDANNRMLFTQDGEQKKHGKWSFQFSDPFERAVLSGIYHGTPDRKECNLQNVYVTFKYDDISTHAYDASVRRRHRSSENILAGYILHCPSSINSDSLEVLKANYYDSYDYKNKVSGFGSSLDYVEDENYGKRYANGEQTPLNCKDLLTGSMVRILDTDQMLYNCFYYDYNRNLIQDRHTTVNGKTAVSKSAFNFCSQPTATGEEYDDSIRLGKRYTYDHAKRLTKETHTIGNDTICFIYSYDETGRIQSLTRINGNDSLTTANSYNIRDWLTAIDSPVFKQSLHYTDGVGTPCYNGNVSSMTWQTDSLATRGYQFSYDGLSRLKAAVYGEGSSLTDNLNRFGEQVTAYDKMGNILGIKRHGQTAENDYGIIDNLSLTYNGNQLEVVNDNATHTAFNNSFEFKDGAKQTIEYIYDANGNLTQDLNKKITDIQYNCLNLPSRIEFEDGNTISYLYDANGTKLRAKHIIDGITTTTDYCDNAIYENGALDKLMTEYGYVTLSDTAYHYFVQDHQGNNRAVVNQDGTVEEVNHFYPFGGVFASTASIQPFKYNGKELDRNGGLDWYGYGARMYDPILGRFVTTDPLAEISYMVNPYAYCMNNPFNRVDPSGMASHYNWETNRYEDETGNEVSWESVQQEYGIAKSEGQSNDDPPSRDDVDGITGAAVRVDANVTKILNVPGLITGEPAFLPGFNKIPLKNIGSLLKVLKNLFRSKNVIKDLIVFGQNENQTYHAFRHVDELGLSKDIVSKAIISDFSGKYTQVVTGKPFNQIIEVGGKRLQYTVYKLNNGKFNIGRIHGID